MTDHYDRSELDHRPEPPRVRYCECKSMKDTGGEECPDCGGVLKFLDWRRIQRSSEQMKKFDWRRR